MTLGFGFLISNQESIPLWLQIGSTGLILTYEISLLVNLWRRNN